jgi:hypothetical protein
VGAQFDCIAPPDRRDRLDGNGVGAGTRTRFVVVGLLSGAPVRIVKGSIPAAGAGRLARPMPEQLSASTSSRGGRERSARVQRRVVDDLNTPLFSDYAVKFRAITSPPTAAARC